MTSSGHQENAAPMPRGSDGHETAGKVLGLVGIGQVGTRVAALAHCWGSASLRPGARLGQFHGNSHYSAALAGLP